MAETVIKHSPEPFVADEMVDAEPHLQPRQSMHRPSFSPGQTVGVSKVPTRRDFGGGVWGYSPIFIFSPSPFARERGPKGVRVPHSVINFFLTINVTLF